MQKMDFADDSLQRHNKTRLVLVFLMIAVVTVLHYSTMGSQVAYHTLYRELYFVPIILMSSWYGLEKGFYTAVLVIFLYTPHVFMTWKEQPGVNLGNLMQIMVFILVAMATGFLSDREKERFQGISEARKLAALGRATLALTSELQEVLKTLRKLQTTLADESSQAVDATLSAAMDRISMLNEMLSQFKPGQEGRHKDFVEIGSAIERARENTAKTAKINGIALRIQVDEAAGLLRVNRENFGWMLEELITNAIEHSERGATITVCARRFEDRHEISVNDPGRGILPENLSKIFVPFYTTKEKGAGLGLAVCRRMMQDSGGDILVESRPGEGSTFTLVFPKADT